FVKDGMLRPGGPAMAHHSVLKVSNQARAGVGSHSSTQPARRSFYPALFMSLIVICAAVFPAATPVRAPSAAPAQLVTLVPVERPLVTNNTDPPGTIDGAKNPELIPDEVAWKMLFLAVAEPITATDEQKARARGKLAQALLPDDDTDAFILLMGQFHEGITAMDSERLQIRARNPFPDAASTDYSRLVELARQRKQLIAETINALPARLSEHGMTNLRAHLERQKRGMKYFPEPK